MVFSENIIRQNIAQEKKPPMLPAEEYLAQNIPGDSRNFFEEYFGSLHVYNRTEISRR